MTIGNEFSKKGLKELRINHLHTITSDEIVMSEISQKLQNWDYKKTFPGKFFLFLLAAYANHPSTPNQDKTKPSGFINKSGDSLTTGVAEKLHFLLQGTSDDKSTLLLWGWREAGGGSALRL